MNNLDIISELEKEYNITFLLGKDRNIDEDYYSENYFFINNKDEIIKLVIINLNKPIDFQHIIGLSKLETLLIYSNKINNFNKIIYFKNLIQLSLRECFIKELTPLKFLNNLSYLDLSSNEISDISVLKKLEKLTYVALRNNKIIDISPIVKLINIKTLFLWNNEISNIEVLSKLKNLENLDIGRNNISEIAALSNLNYLTILDIAYNKISDLRPLEMIISKNFIVTHNEYDPELENIIFLNQNHFTIPPNEVIEQGNETIIQYFEDARTYNLKSLNECKLIFVGDGGLGKTSLMKKIIGLPYTKEETTHGINKKSWNEIKNKEGEEIRVNLWDFGGQHIQHSLHQFFLTEKVIYILLLDPRNDSSAIYWLEQIEKLGKGSEVLIVYNWKEEKDKNSHNNKNFYELRKTYPKLRRSLKKHLLFESLLQSD